MWFVEPPTLTQQTNHPMLRRLVGQLVEQETALGEEGVAERLGIKVRMWKYVKAGTYGLSARTLRAALRNFPTLQHEIVDYMTADEAPAA